MASTYSDLKIELIGTGEQVGTWGATTNTNLGTAIEDAITGSANVSFSSADVTLTLTNTNGSQTARNLRLVCTGTSGGARNLILGSGCQIDKLYLVQNDLADTVTVKNTTGTGVAIPTGAKKFVFNNGTNVVDAITFDLSSGISGTLPVANGGTGAVTLTGVVKGNGTSAFTAGTVNLASEVTGTLPIANGGTGATTNTQARTNLGLGTIATQASNNVLITGGSITGITDLAVADGGTGASDAAGARTNLGLGSMATQNSNNVSITGGSIQGVGLVSGSAQSPTSGTVVDFTGVPSWAKRVTVILSDVDLSGSSNLLVQLGTSGGVVTTGYAAGFSAFGGGALSSSINTDGIRLQKGSGGGAPTPGIVTICKVTGNTWVGSGSVNGSTAGGGSIANGTITLSGTLDRVRVTSVNGTDTFTGGTINIMFE
jgi:hypothetical protein